MKIDCWGSFPVSMWMKLRNPQNNGEIKWMTSFWWFKECRFFSHIATECVFSANLLVLHLHNTRPGHAERHKAQSHWRCQSEVWDRKMLNHFKSRRNEMYDKGLQPIGCFGGCWMNSLIPLGQRNPSPSFPWGLSKELRNELTNFMEARLRLKAKLQKETAFADSSGMNMHVLLVFSLVSC